MLPYMNTYRCDIVDIRGLFFFLSFVFHDIVLAHYAHWFSHEQWCNTNTDRVIWRWVF